MIKDREIDGIVEIVSATVTGSSVEGTQLSLTGEFRVNQGQGLIGDNRVPAKDLTAVVLVEAGRVRVSSLSGLYGTIHMNESKALVSFLEAGPWVEMGHCRNDDCRRPAAASRKYRHVGTAVAYAGWLA